MNRTSLIRLDGLAAMVVSVPLVIVWLWEAVSFRHWMGSPLAAPAIHLLMVSVMAAIVALHALQSQHYGLRGMAASLASFVGLAMYLVGAGVANYRDDFFLAFADASLLAVWGLLLATIGIIALGIFTLEAGVLPWWCGVALAAGNPLIGFFLAFFLGSLWGVAWLVVGYAIFRVGTRQTERPSRVR